MSEESPLLEIRDLDVEFRVLDRPVHALRGIDLAVREGEIHALVGESGSGKSVTAMSVLRLLPRPPARLNRGSVHLRGNDLLGLSDEDMREIRGGEIAMVFQEPTRYLNPSLSIGEQIIEMLTAHRGLDRRVAREKAQSLLGRVGLGSDRRVLRSYVHELSGGMRQRGMIAMAVSCDPCLLIADEPVTALDVTIQRRILDLLLSLSADLSMAVLFISHDLSIVHEISDRVSVIYAGKIVEGASRSAIFGSPLHPYTGLLIASVPDPRRRGERLQAIPGRTPDASAVPGGCAFHPRCPRAEDICRTEMPRLIQHGPDHWAACHLVGS